MVEKNKAPFPQANDFNKIVLLIELDDDIYLSNKEYLMEYLTLGTERQIAYYISACEFLGLINSHKKFTDLCVDIKKSSYDSKILKLSRLIIGLPVFGEVFFMEYLYGVKMKNDDISQLINTIYGIDNIEVCKRRASTVSKWIDWINNNKN